MGQWLSWVKSNDKQILSILDQLAKKGVATSEELVQLFANIDKISEHHTEIKKLEREADALTRSVFSELNKTLILFFISNLLSLLI